MAAAANGGALAGVRVLDVSQMLAGPLCGMRLGDLGADVIKVEPPRRGEYNRTHGFAGVELAGESTTFLALNRNKRSLALDLKSEAGKEVFLELAADSDVVLQNFRNGTAERLGIGPERLMTLNQGLVYCSISGYGSRGPYRDRPGQDLVVQGYSGSMWSVGRAGDPPVPGALWAADVMTGYQATIGILAALRAREHSGRGQHVEVNLLSVLLDAQAQELVTYLNADVAPRRDGEPSAHALIPAPYSVFETADSWVTLAMAELGRLADALADAGIPWDELAQLDPVADREPIHRGLAPLLRRLSTREWLALADRHKLWMGPVYGYEEVAGDPHVQETGMLDAVTHPRVGELRMPGVPIGLSGTPPAVRLPPPLLGEHSAEVLRERLSYDDDRIERLRAEEVI